ncbi:MAG TPA: neutral zinc metallopeptidase [Tenuifilaceae bacterium]|nr:neutral zinc metallopeptidase [Tenuifilaceae bacterium]HOZ14084.1 neutral zinc metallopeptidase [Tenuifilaceae bacterium]HPI43976.1 neutral zinc metallopeptidase [Tenuifilaceae bacterium]HPN21382.1 neutral zinc metallopeptidase [Tenuifilaceae bacterium]
MLWKGRRQSNNVEDLRKSGGRRAIGFKGGIIGTLILAAIVYFLGGDPLQVLNMQGDVQNMDVTETPLTEHDEEMGQFVAVILADTEDVWNKIFASMGKTYREPKLVLFRGSVSSACGYAQDATGPFYCPGDEKVYIDLDYLEQLQNKLGANGDFATAYIIAHEVGHHVQNLLGTISKVNQYYSSGVSEAEANKMTVKLELQADFLAGVWVHHAQKMKNFLEEGDLDEALNAASAVGDDTIQKKTRGYVTPDSFQHGTSEQRKSWLYKGIKSGNLNDGNTFKLNEL